MTSPGRTGRPVLRSTSPRSSQSRIVPRDRPRHAPLGLVADPRRARQRPGLAAPAPRSAGRASGHSSTRPGSLARSVSWCSARPGSTTPPLRLRQREHRVDQRQHRGHRPERAVEQLGPDRPTGGRGPRRQPLAHARGSWRGRHPGSCRSTASRRRPRTGCARRSRAPAPAKNSSVSLSTIAHWRGLVSCASSTRTWSMRASSL